MSCRHHHIRNAGKSIKSTSSFLSAYTRTLQKLLVQNIAVVLSSDLSAVAYLDGYGEIGSHKAEQAEQIERLSCGLHKLRTKLHVTANVTFVVVDIFFCI